MELPFAAIHRLCAPILDGLDVLAEPQQNALRVALGVSSGDAPDRFLVAVAVLNLLSATAEKRPLLCLVDDAQWLDAASVQALGFVARRLLAEPVAMIFSLREPTTTRALDGLPQLLLEGLDEPDARALLSSAVPGRLDDRVRDRIIAETGGNPLALVELSQRMSPSERAGGFAPPAAGDLPSRLEEEYLRRVAALPEATQRLMLLAAAEPLGDAALLWRAAERLSTDPGALAPATEAGLLDDRRPRSVPPPAGALSGVPSRVARRTTARARRAGGRERSRARRRPPRLAPRPCGCRTRRSRGRRPGTFRRTSAEPRRSRGRCGVPRAGHRSDPGPGPPGRARAGRGGGELPGRAISTRRSGSWPWQKAARSTVSSAREPRSCGARLPSCPAYGNEAAPLLLDAAKQLEPFDVSLARRAYLTAWTAAVTANHLGGAGVLLEVCRAVRALPPLALDPHPLDLVIEGFALLITDGHAAAMPTLQRAAKEVLQLPVEDVVRWGCAGWRRGVSDVGR